MNRNHKGAPGPKVLAARADYDIKASLDEVALWCQLEVKTITYYNNSPDPLTISGCSADENQI